MERSWINVNFKSIYYFRHKESIDKHLTKVTQDEIRTAYMESAAKGQYQASIILHIIFSLTLHLHHLFDLRFEDVLLNNKIQWYDSNSSSFKSGFLLFWIKEWHQLYKGNEETNKYNLDVQ